MAASAVIALSACGTTATTAPGPPAGAQKLLSRLASAARGAPERDVRLFRHGPWILASTRTSGQVCFALALVGTTLESTCATRAQLAGRPLLVSTGNEPRVSGHGWSDSVVYGFVSPDVRSLAVRLSDCTTLAARFSTRPLFWVFVPRAKLARRILPVGYVARIGPQVVRGELRPMSSPSGRCAPKR